MSDDEGRLKAAIEKIEVENAATFHKRAMRWMAVVATGRIGHVKLQPHEVNRYRRTAMR